MNKVLTNSKFVNTFVRMVLVTQFIMNYVMIYLNIILIVLTSVVRNARVRVVCACVRAVGLNGSVRRCPGPLEGRGRAGLLGILCNAFDMLFTLILRSFGVFIRTLCGGPIFESVANESLFYE